MNRPAFYSGSGCSSSFTAVFLFKGVTIINPNHSVVCTFFGKYAGTVKENGLQFVNPLYSKQSISLRYNNFESSRLKVNDKMGNPIEIAAIIVWQVKNTYRAAFEVIDYQQYVKLQSESAVRHLATTCPYDEMEDTSAEITLRNGGEKVTAMLEQELDARLMQPALSSLKRASVTSLIRQKLQALCCSGNRLQPLWLHGTK